MIWASDGKDACVVGQHHDRQWLPHGNQSIAPLNEPNYFALYEKNKVMVAAEYGRPPVSLTLRSPGFHPATNGY